jgi:hypothetical protein
MEKQKENYEFWVRWSKHASFTLSVTLKAAMKT